jgi:hypothetical protein
MSQSFSANYSGRQAPPSSYVKSFYTGSANPLWKLTSDPTQSLEPISDTNDVRLPQDLYVNGDLHVAAVIYNDSDERIKDEIKQIDRNMYDNLLKLSPKKYSFKNDTNKKEHYGFIAQDVEKVYPSLVTCEKIGNEDGMKSVNYIELIPFLVAKIQDLQQEVDLLKAKK